MKKKTGLILGGIFLFSLVLTVSLVMAALEEATAGATVTVNEFLDITLSGAVPIAFGTHDPGTNNNPANPDGNNAPQAVTITIETTTNVVTDTFLKGNNWVTPAALAISNVLYDDDEKLLGGSNDVVTETVETTLIPKNLATTYTGANTGFFEDVACPCGSGASVKSVHFWLSVPAGQQAGAYTSTNIFFKTVTNGVAP